MPTAQHGSLTVSPRRKNLHITVTIKGWSALRRRRILRPRQGSAAAS